MSTLSQTMNRFLTHEGSVEGPLENTLMFRVDKAQQATPIIYEPSIYFVAQGCKEAWLEDQRYVYNPGQFLLLTVPLPLRCRVFLASPEKPFMALRLGIDPGVVNELLAQMPQSNDGLDQSEQGIFVSQMTESLRGSVTRLVETLSETSQKNVLAPMIYREILFHVLQGSEGKRLRDFATADRHSNRIALVIDFINQNFDQPIRVEELASIAAMSESSFYQHFKNVAQLSPVQYLKNIRLHHAKHQIFVEQLAVSEAAYRVGYESASQFSREYKRLFGFSPAQHLREAG